MDIVATNTLKSLKRRNWASIISLWGKKYKYKKWHSGSGAKMHGNLNKMALLGRLKFPGTYNLKHWNLTLRLCQTIKHSWQSNMKWFDSDSNKLLAENTRFAQKICIFICFLTVIPLFYAQKWIAHISLCPFTLFKEQLERFVPIALYKRATMSNSLKLHMIKERP